MRLRLALGLCLATLLALGLPGPAPASAEGFEVSRPKVTRSTRVRSAPTLPSDEELEEEEAVPAEADSAWEDYYRERADYYREKRKTERNRRSGGTACIYGGDGTVLYAPPGRDC